MDADDGLDPRARARVRNRALALEGIPRWYIPWVHLMGTTGIGMVVLVCGVFGIHELHAVELLTLPAVLVVANGFEWRVHRDLLHRRRWPLQELYDRHTPQHHAIFMTEDMAIQSWREFRLVLIPAVGVLGVVLFVIPFAYLAGRIAGQNCGWLVLITAGLYMVTYELSHLSYHLPPDGFIGRRWLVRVLREHHARHHDPELMARWNFNVTLPLFDWICGTMAPKSVRPAAQGANELPLPRRSG